MRLALVATLTIKFEFALIGVIAVVVKGADSSTPKSRVTATPVHRSVSGKITDTGTGMVISFDS